MSEYGEKLNPYRQLRVPNAIRGIRQNIVITMNPATIDEKQQLSVRFPNLSNNDVIIPGTVRLAFEIVLNSKDTNATVFQNLGRLIIKKNSN